MPVIEKTCEVCNKTMNRASFAKHLRSKLHLINNGELENKPVCYIRIKKKSAERG